MEEGIMHDPVTSYAESILAEPKKHNKFVRLAAERHLRDLKDARFTWDVDEAVRRIAMCKTMRHYKGESKGKPFVPEPWEEFIIGSVFGWKLQDGTRRFRYAFVKVPRKNGKTFIAAGIALMMMVAGGQLNDRGGFDSEGGAEVYFVATKEDQAKIGWGDCCKIIKRSPGWSDILDVRVKEIRSDANDGICKPLGSDSDSLDGLNPSCAIKDELHAWKDRGLWDQIDDAFGARQQPLDFIITTEGTVREGIHDEIDKHARAILESKAGEYVDENFFAIIWGLDEGDDPFDEASWWKANPNLGVSKSLEYMRDQAAKARQMPGKLSAFLTKQLNVRQDQDEAWLSLDQWDACRGDVKLEELAGRDSVMALDLARVNDWSSLCQAWKVDGDDVAFSWQYFIPEETYEKLKRDGRVPVDVWKRAGFLTVTDGDVTDFTAIEDFIARRAATHPASEFVYDPMFATDLALRLRDNHGLNVVEFKQTFTNFTPACSEFERMLLGKNFRHGGNPIARWNAQNVVLRKGPSGNYMPDKQTSRAKIDGITAALMATARIVLAPAAVTPFIA